MVFGRISNSFLNAVENNALLIIQPTIWFLGFFLSKIDEISHLDVFKTSLYLPLFFPCIILEHTLELATQANHGQDAHTEINSVKKGYQLVTAKFGLH